MPRGKVYKYKSLEFYAADGVICIIDENDEKPEEQMEVCTPAEFIKRAIAVHFKWSQNKAPSEWSETSKLLEDALACAKEAQKQTEEMVYDIESKNRKILIPRVFTSVPNLDEYNKLTPEAAKAKILEMIKREKPEEVLKRGLE
jgi:hypothetical protein